MINFDSTESLSYWNQPNAYRLIQGMISFVNYQSKDYSWQSSIDFDQKNNNLEVFLNCNQESIAKIKEVPVKSDEYMIGTAQNILEFLHPTEMSLPINYFIE